MEVRKHNVRPIAVGLVNLARQIRLRSERRQENRRRAKFEQLRDSVHSTISAIRDLTSQQCADVAFLEKEFIPSLGLNDELLHEQPPELSPYFGRGLHIWQYPNQLARYLAWLTRNANDTNCYMEIGCRWGGMTILITEWLRKNGATLHAVIAIDPIELTPFIDEYFRFLEHERTTGQHEIDTFYICNYSTSIEVRRLVEGIKPDFVFVDGDHALKVALADHMLARGHARVIVHHDVSSQSCPDTTLLWTSLKLLERHDFEFFEFADQYESVNGNFLGIGAMKRKQSTLPFPLGSR